MADVEPVAAEPPMSPAEAPAPGTYAALRAAARSTAQNAQQGAQQNAARLQQQASAAAAEKKAQFEAAARQAQDELGDPALKASVQKSMEATKARAAVAAREAQAQAADAAARGAAAASAAAEATGQMAVAAADVARAQFEQRWNDVLAQERLLAEEAKRLEKYERQLLSLMRKDQPNFPKKCCCIEPMVYHDISVDIGKERQPFVQRAYVNYYITCFLLIYNLGVAIAMLVMADKPGKTSSSSLTSHMVIAIIEAVLGIPLAFVLWYWPVYKACGTGSSGQHVMSYVGLGVAFVFNVLVTVGFTGFGGCGLLYGLSVQNSKGSNAFYPCLANAIAFGAQAFYFALMGYRMKCIYGAEDKASIAAANLEMAGNTLFAGFRV